MDLSWRLHGSGPTAGGSTGRPHLHNTSPRKCGLWREAQVRTERGRGHIWAQLPTHRLATTRYSTYVCALGLQITPQRTIIARKHRSREGV